MGPGEFWDRRRWGFRWGDIKIGLAPPNARAHLRSAVASFCCQWGKAEGNLGGRDQVTTRKEWKQEGLGVGLWKVRQAMQLLALVESKEREGAVIQGKETSSDSRPLGTTGSSQSNACLVWAWVKVITALLASVSLWDLQGTDRAPGYSMVCKDHTARQEGGQHVMTGPSLLPLTSTSVFFMTRGIKTGYFFKVYYFFSR